MTYLGLGAYVNPSRVVLVLLPGSKYVKRQMQQAEQEGRLWHANGRKPCLSVLVLDNGMVIKSSLRPDTVVKRLLGAGAADVEVQ